MLYLLIDDSGTPLGEFDERDAAIAALDALIAADPAASEDCGVVVLDEHGRRVGEPIARPAAA